MNTKYSDARAQETKKRIRKDRREEILQAAAGLFSEYGFQNTPLSAVAQAVGLTEPGVLHYFPTKLHLLEGVLQYREQAERVKYAGMFGPGENVLPRLNVLARLLEVLEDSLREKQKDPALVLLFSVLVSESMRVDHPSHDHFASRYESIRASLVEALRGMLGAEIPAQMDLHGLVTIIIALIDGLQIQWLLAPEKVNMAETFHLFSTILLGYLHGQPGAERG